MRTISIIGYGAFSKFMVQHLQGCLNVVVYSRRPNQKNKASLGFKFVSLEEALNQDLIVLSIPAQYIGEFLKTNGKLVNPKALVVDVASVKLQPVADMKRYLPSSCEIIGTHPIFGPGSGAKGIEGLRVVLCPVRCRPESLATLRSLLEQKKLIVIEKSPEDHDKAMAYVLGLTQYIGRALQAIQAHDTELTTPAYEDLMEMRAIQGNDSWDLFYSIMRTNPYAKPVAREFRAAFDMLDGQLDAEEKVKQGEVA